MFKTVLVPIDLAQRSSWEHALPQAIQSVASGGTVTVITVVRNLKAAFEGKHFPLQSKLMISSARGKLTKIASAYRNSNVAVNEEVRFGSIGQEILSAAQERGADLIVMASHRPQMKDYFIGPNAAYVAQHASCSVLVLRQPHKVQ
jgi:Universal stress protein UspA and related nucleotide-binding proteins